MSSPSSQFRTVKKLVMSQRDFEAKIREIVAVGAGGLDEFFAETTTKEIAKLHMGPSARARGAGGFTAEAGGPPHHESVAVNSKAANVESDFLRRRHRGVSWLKKGREFAAPKNVFFDPQRPFVHADEEMNRCNLSALVQATEDAEDIGNRGMRLNQKEKNNCSDAFVEANEGEGEEELFSLVKEPWASSPPLLPVHTISKAMDHYNCRMDTRRALEEQLFSGDGGAVASGSVKKKGAAAPVPSVLSAAQVKTREFLKKLQKAKKSTATANNSANSQGKRHDTVVEEEEGKSGAVHRLLAVPEVWNIDALKQV